MKFLIFAFSFIVYNSSFAQVVYPFKKGSKWGFVNEKKKWVIPAKYDSISAREDFYFTHKFMGSVGGRNVYVDGVVSAEGKHILDTTNLGIFGAPKDGFLVGNKVTYQVIYNWNGTKIRDIASGSDFTGVEGGYLKFHADQGYQLMDTAFKAITYKFYDDIRETPFRDLFIVEKADKSGIFSAKNKQEIVALNYNEIDDNTSDNVFIATGFDGLKATLDKTGKLIYKAPNNSYNYIGNNIWSSKKSKDQHLLFKDGKALNNKIYKALGTYHENLLLAERDDKIYVVDGKGNETLVKHKLGSNITLSSFHEGLAAIIYRGDNFLFVNKKGDVVIPITKNIAEFKGERYFENGYCIITYEVTKPYNFKVGVIDKKGAWVLKPNYSDIKMHKMKNKIFFSVEDSEGNRFYVNSKGEELREL